MGSLDFRREQKRESILRDVRTPTQRFKDSLLEYKYPFLWLGCTAVGAIALNPIAEAMVIAGWMVANSAIIKQRKAGLPSSYPKSAKKLDPKNVNHKGEWQMGEGIFYCGIDRHTGKELWIDAEQFKRHSFFFGTTGSGKTEFLLSVLLNSLIQGSSFVFIDGKGDIKLYYSSYSQARALGREHDILLLNFLTGEKDIIGAQDSQISNTFNYFGAGNSDAATQTTNSIIDAEEDIWGKRATSFVESEMKPLVFLRNEYGLNLDAEVVRSYFSIHQLERLFLIYPFIYDGLSATLSGIKNYFVNLPDWSIKRSICYYEFLSLLANKDNVHHLKQFKRQHPDLWLQIKEDFELEQQHQEGKLSAEEYKKQKESGAQPNQPNSSKGEGQASETMLQHGYITMQLVQVFNSLADTYGYIMRTSCPDIDMRDVILHRRILIALLPALAKSPAELKNLGRIILSVIKTAMTVGLGYKAEGDTMKIIHTRPTDAETPIPIVADECGVYLINGAFVLPAQGRSLGVGMVFAAQDITALLQNLDKETYSILGNTVNKFCGKLDDKESAEYFENLAGEGKFAVLSGFEKANEDGHSFKQSNTINLESIKRVSFNDLRSHTAGHWHYFFGNSIYYIQSFYANTKTVSYLRVNHFLQLANIGAEEYFAIERIMEDVENVLDKSTGSHSTLSKYIDRFIKPKATLERETEEQKYEWTAKDIFPKDNIARSNIIANILLNSQFNQEYSRQIQKAHQVVSQLDEDYHLPKEAVGSVMYNPYSLPYDLDLNHVNEMFNHNHKIMAKNPEQIQVMNKVETERFTDLDDNAIVNEFRFMVLSAALSGKTFNAVIEGQRNKAVLESRKAALQSAQAVKSLMQEENKDARQKIGYMTESLQNPDLSADEIKNKVNLAEKISSQIREEYMNYSIFRNQDDNKPEDVTPIMFDDLIEKIYQENPNKLH